MTMEVAGKREYLPPVGVALRRGLPARWGRDSMAVPMASCVPSVRLWCRMSPQASLVIDAGAGCDRQEDCE